MWIQVPRNSGMRLDLFILGYNAVGVFVWLGDGMLVFDMWFYPFFCRIHAAFWCNLKDLPMLTTRNDTFNYIQEYPLKISQVVYIYMLKPPLYLFMALWHYGHIYIHIVYIIMIKWVKHQPIHCGICIYIYTLYTCIYQVRHIPYYKCSIFLTSFNHEYILVMLFNKHGNRYDLAHSLIRHVFLTYFTIIVNIWLNSSYVLTIIYNVGNTIINHPQITINRLDWNHSQMSGLLLFYPH